MNKMQYLMNVTSASMTPFHMVMDEDVVVMEDECVASEELFMKMACLGVLHKQQLAALDQSLDDALNVMHKRLANTCTSVSVHVDCVEDSISPRLVSSPLSSTTMPFATPSTHVIHPSSNTMVGHQQSFAQPTTSPIVFTTATTNNNTSNSNISNNSNMNTSGNKPSVNADIAKKLKSKYSESTLREAKIFKKRKGYPKHITAILNQWYEEHEAYPYPSQQEKEQLSSMTGLSIHQLSTWFSNTRIRTKRREEKKKAKRLSDKKGQPDVRKCNLSMKKDQAVELKQGMMTQQQSVQSSANTFVPCMVPVYFYDPSMQFYSMPQLMSPQGIVSPNTTSTSAIFQQLPTTSRNINNKITNSTIITASEMVDDVFLKLEEVDSSTMPLGAAIDLSSNNINNMSCKMEMVKSESDPIIDSLMLDNYAASCSLVGEDQTNTLINYFN